MKKHKVVVCGGRNCKDRKLVFDTLSQLHEEKRFTQLAHGGAKGVDSLAGLWAIFNYVPVTVFLPDWIVYGKAAGVRRSVTMMQVFQPDILVAFPGGKGTNHTIEIAKRKKVKCIIVGDKSCDLPKQQGDDDFVGDSKITWGQLFGRKQSCT